MSEQHKVLDQYGSVLEVHVRNEHGLGTVFDIHVVVARLGPGSDPIEFTLLGDLDVDQLIEIGDELHEIASCHKPDFETRKDLAAEKPTLFAKLAKFIELAEQAAAIATSSASEEVIYNLIFSDEISKAIKGLQLQRLEYVDPDAGYMDDVKAYINALEERASEYRKVLEGRS